MLAYNAAVCAARQRAASVGEVERRIAEGMLDVEQPELRRQWQRSVSCGLLHTSRPRETAFVMAPQRRGRCARGSTSSQALDDVATWRCGDVLGARAPRCACSCGSVCIWVGVRMGVGVHVDQCWHVCRPGRQSPNVYDCH